MLLLHDVQSLRDCDRAAKEDTPNLEDPPGPDARLPSSLNYNMHENVPCRVVQIASSLVSWHQPRVTVALPGMQKHREILVIRSSFLMRLLSHNRLSTPFYPPVLGDREEELGETPKPPPGSVLDLFRDGHPGSIPHRLRVVTCVHGWI